MPPESLFPDSNTIRVQDLDPDALAVLVDLYRRLDAHWEHKPVSEDPDAIAPKWAIDSTKHILLVKQGSFGRESKLPIEWLQAHAPNHPLTHHPFATWEQVRDFVLHAADAMLADPSYRIGSHFFPTTMDAWFLTKPPRKPRWSCFLRHANKVRTLEALDLEHQPTHDAKIQRIRGKMSPEAVEVVETALKGKGIDCFPGTSWDRAGKLYGWWKGEKFAEIQIQFGFQLDRPVSLRHAVRVEQVAGTFSRLVGSIIQWSWSRGGWKGWFPVPGGEEWESFCDWCSAEHGACLRIVATGKQVPRKTEPKEWEKYFDISA